MALNNSEKRQSALLEPGAIPYLPDGVLSTNDKLLALELYNFDPIIILDALGIFEDAIVGSVFEPVF